MIKIKWGYCIRAHLTPQSVRNKRGSPKLDYVLRPRYAAFAKRPFGMCVGNQVPQLLRTFLSFGADPNQTYQRVSVWSLFLGFIADHFQEIILDGTFIEELTYLEALRILIETGADLLLPDR